MGPPGPLPRQPFVKLGGNKGGTLAAETAERGRTRRGVAGVKGTERRARVLERPPADFRRGVRGGSRPARRRFW